jgi:plastocyanin
MRTVVSRGISVVSVASTIGALGLGVALAAQSHAATAAPSVQNTVTMYVLPGPLAKKVGYKGSDGRYHDMFTPTNIVVKAGETVRVNVINYDDGTHSITSPSLGINELIKGGKDIDTKEPADVLKKELTLGIGEDTIPVTTSFTLHITKVGTYRWFCTQPCDGQNGSWAMSADSTGSGHVGYMAGYIVVI